MENIPSRPSRGRERHRPSVRARYTPDGLDLDTLLRDSITTSPYRYQAKVIVDLPPAQLQARIPPAVGVVRSDPHDKSRSLLSVGSDSLDALAGHLVALGVAFDVIEPPELRDRIDRLADALDRARSLRPTSVSPDHPLA